MDGQHGGLGKCGGGWKTAGLAWQKLTGGVGAKSLEVEVLNVRRLE
jgi:hypothetical protein